MFGYFSCCQFHFVDYPSLRKYFAIVLSKLRFWTYSPGLPAPTKMMDENRMQTWLHSLMEMASCQCHCCSRQRARRPCPAACSARNFLICSRISAQTLLQSPYHWSAEHDISSSPCTLATMSGALHFLSRATKSITNRFRTTCCVIVLSIAFSALIAFASSSTRF